MFRTMASWIPAGMAALLFFGAFALHAAAENRPTAPIDAHGSLAAYVVKPDSSYGWVKRRSGAIGLGRYAELTLTSQTWKDIVWKHQLFVIKPSSVSKENDHALLFIAGGSWKPELEQADGEKKMPREATAFALLAESLKTPVAILLHVPQQPILGGKYEDQIIAHTFERYLATGDQEWPLLLPMVRVPCERWMQRAISVATSGRWRLTNIR